MAKVIALTSLALAQQVPNVLIKTDEIFEVGKAVNYRWPDDSEKYTIEDSDSLTYELKFGENGTSDIVTKFEHWTRRKHNEKTGKDFFEWHGRCIFENFAAPLTTADSLTCSFAVQREIFTLRDWSVVEAADPTDMSSWKCTDMHQPDDALAENPVIDDNYQNCYVMEDGSESVSTFFN